MASTIQDCASLSAAERRQRRKDRILGSADARLEKLLPGTTKVPSFDDGEDISYKSSKELLSTSIAGEDESCDQTLNNTQEIDFVEPSYVDLIDINRVQACIAAGALLRILTFFHVINRVLPFWLPISISYHSYLLYQVEKRFPKHGYIVNFLLVGGMNEKLVRYLGLTIDVLWSFSMDTMIMAFGFIVVHIVIFALSFMF